MGGEGSGSLVGKKIRSFRVVDLLGKGGMGEVYVGFDETLERRVALKSIRSEARLKPEAKVRFLREARILAELHHPNICQIFDYIEGDDSDLIVLELISGRSLRQAVQEKLGEATKMRVAEQITQVLVAAHAKGIIHRDLKPDNVMLTPQGQAKVLDFGLSRSAPEEKTIALARRAQHKPEPEADGSDPFPTVPAEPAPAVSGTLDAFETDATVFQPDDDEAPPASSAMPAEFKTRLGSIIGSPGYMSPEQANGDAASPASDMYSLGILLQELFTERSAYEPTNNLMSFLARVQRAQRRPVTGIDPDLTALIDRLTSLASGARPSAADTAERLAWIRGKPRRRRRGLLKGAAAVLVILFAVAMTIQSVRVGREAERANREAERANNEAAASAEVSRFLVDLFEIADPSESRGNQVTARELLDAGAARIERELAQQPVLRGRLMHTMGQVYQRLGLYQPAEDLLVSALQVGEKELGAEHADVAKTLTAFGHLLRVLGRHEEAEANLRRARKILEQQVNADNETLVSCLSNLANLYLEQARPDEALPLYQRALVLAEQVYGADHPRVADVLNNLAALYESGGEHSKALALYERTLAIWESEFGPVHPDVGLVVCNIANLYMTTEEYDKARPLFERALAIREQTLGPDHPDVAQTLYNFAEMLRASEEYETAVAQYRRSASILERALGPDNPYVSYPLNGLAVALGDLQRYDEAEALLQRALRLREDGFGRDHPLFARTLTVYVSLLRETGREEEARALEAELTAGQPPQHLQDEP